MVALNPGWETKFRIRLGFCGGNLRRGCCAKSGNRRACNANSPAARPRLQSLQVSLGEGGPRVAAGRVEAHTAEPKATAEGLNAEESIFLRCNSFVWLGVSARGGGTISRKGDGRGGT